MQFGINLSHETKLVKLFLISLSEYVRTNFELLNYSSSEMLFSSVLNFVNSLVKSNVFSQSAEQVDFLDLSLTLFN